MWTYFLNFADSETSWCSDTVAYYWQSSRAEAHVGSLPYWSIHFIVIWLVLFLLWASWICQWYAWEPHAFMFFLLSTITISWFCSWWAQAGVCKCEISTAEQRAPEPSLPIWQKLFINAIYSPLYLAPATGGYFYGSFYLLMIEMGSLSSDMWQTIWHASQLPWSS